jgi:hypothetical protein
MGTLEGTTPLAPPEANATVPQSEGFLPSLGINPRELFPSLGNGPPPQEAPKVPGKRLQEHNSNGAERPPIKALIGLVYRDMEQALLDHSTSSNSTLCTKIAAIKAYIASFIEAME